MTNSTDPSFLQRPDLSDDLPPVQPPSAGFIMQLFVVPGLIVLAVVVVWAAFGRIAASDEDWHGLVEELQSLNGHRRVRAMHGLADVLVRDGRRGEQGQNLAANPEIAKALSEQLSRELKSGSTSNESLAIQEFLARAVGLLDAPETSMLPLRMALEPTRDIEIRKSGALSIAMIAGRAFEKGTPLEDPDTVNALVETSTDTLPVMRQTAAYALAFFKSERADQQLHVLLANSDRATGVNAAIALTRHGNTDGLAVFKQALTAKPPEKAEDQFEHFNILTNTLKAIAKLSSKMSEADREEFREILQSLVNNHREVRIRIDAQNALQSLK